jgi:hypothetical protein
MVRAWKNSIGQVLAIQDASKFTKQAGASFNWIQFFKPIARYKYCVLQL